MDRTLAQPLVAGYLERVTHSDPVGLLIGAVSSEPVEKESAAALNAQRPILAFVKGSAQVAILFLSTVFVIGQMFIVVFGLGRLLRTYGSRFDAENLFSILLMVAGFALACSFVVQGVERRVTRWVGPRR